MAKIYARLIIDGKRDFESIPEGIKEQVKEALTTLGHPELAGDD